MVYSNDRIASTKVLSRKSGAAEAEALLHKCATAVKHLMRRNGWYIRELSEFFPKMPGLLGMNKNRSVILVRLRYADNETLLYSFEEVLGTLLHELAHMAHSDHSVAFYELWDKNRAEVGADIAGGALNYDFARAGKVLGGDRRTTAADNLGDPRQRAAEAAIKRKGRFAGTGEGQRLGGGEGEKRLSKQELRARIALAAERRLNDNKWCNAEEDSDDVYREFSQEEVTLCNPCDTENSDNNNINSGNFSRDSTATNAADITKKNKSSSSSSSSSLKSSDGITAAENNNALSIEMVCSRCGYCTTGDENCPTCQDRIYMQFKQRKRKQRLFIDLTSSPRNAASSQIEQSTKSRSSGRSSSSSSNSRNNNRRNNSNEIEEWECKKCTFLNPKRVTKCSMCETKYI